MVTVYKSRASEEAVRGRQDTAVPEPAPEAPARVLATASQTPSAPALQHALARLHDGGYSESRARAQQAAV